MKMDSVNNAEREFSAHRRAMIGRIRDKIAHIGDTSIRRKSLFIYLFAKGGREDKCLSYEGARNREESTDIS